MGGIQTSPIECVLFGLQMCMAQPAWVHAKSEEHFCLMAAGLFLASGELT